MKIIAVHLSNDCSESSKILRQLVKGWTKNHISTELYVGSGEKGFLSNTTTTHHYWYSSVKNPIFRLLFILASQCILFFKLLFNLKKSDILYINTVVPFGAALAGKIRGCKIMYHIHDTRLTPKIFKLFLFGVVKWAANEVVYVSNFLAEQEPLKIKSNVIYNVLEKDFLNQCKGIKTSQKESKIILMICSLKANKGVSEFLHLAHLNRNYTFKLVLDANQKEIDNYFKLEFLPENLVIYPTQTDTHPFYKEASIVLNLSDTRSSVETFGITILEAMAYGLPTIVPPVGGVVELVKEGENGFLIDSKNIPLLTKRLNELLQNQALYQKMSATAKEYSRFFCEEYFESESTRILLN
ncbi:Glycosyltransferase involved in cell wall bisynthesis [Flavobacterium succinicans]|jgi:glycosyltransferase involved in cell wall biosynthesis|uniref:Glycosyltransferase involved in cell wall bisynthesis n=1 Tax=Flavobacterium succinicans TaxID=29536 RepID=A0A1I4ZMA4_9FLAO|nr:glycosyltransferase family 4 protein [Flavobacterium succinicans]SFN51100.1 Glycosyltransferase involved in cell wall bisynthesis [Flavobacterium succinicans]